jgi:hypothetical protein
MEGNFGILILLAVIIIGLAVYALRRRGRNQPDGHDT